MTVQESMQLFTPMLYVQDSREALGFYAGVFGLEEITERTMLLSQVPGMADTPDAERRVVYSKLQCGDGSALNVAELSADASYAEDAVVKFSRFSIPQWPRVQRASRPGSVRLVIA